jgi:hypothetical protein
LAVLGEGSVYSSTRARVGGATASTVAGCNQTILERKAGQAGVLERHPFSMHGQRPGIRDPVSEMGQNWQAFERSSGSHAGPLANRAPLAAQRPLHGPRRRRHAGPACRPACSRQARTNQRGSGFPFAGLVSKSGREVPRHGKMRPGARTRKSLEGGETAGRQTARRKLHGTPASDWLCGVQRDGWQLCTYVHTST